jgi:hypothetical protein
MSRKIPQKRKDLKGTRIRTVLCGARPGCRRPMGEETRYCCANHKRKELACSLTRGLRTRLRARLNGGISIQRLISISAMVPSGRSARHHLPPLLSAITGANFVPSMRRAIARNRRDSGGSLIFHRERRSMMSCPICCKTRRFAIAGSSTVESK